MEAVGGFRRGGVSVHLIRAVMMALICLGFIGSSSAANSATAGAPSTTGQELPVNDRLLILNLRAGPFRYLDGWKRSGWKGRRIEYRYALAAFGRPTRMERWWMSEGLPPAYEGTETAGWCDVTWAGAGITVQFFSWSGRWPPDYEATVAPPDIDICARASLERGVLTRIVVFGPGWHNQTGFRIREPRPPRRPYSVSTNVKIPGGQVWVDRSALDTDEERRLKSITVSVNAGFLKK